MLRRDDLDLALRVPALDVKLGKVKDEVASSRDGGGAEVVVVVVVVVDVDDVVNTWPASSS